MPINVTIGDEGTGPLRIDANLEGELKLPSIFVYPIHANQPILIKKIRAELTGSARGVEILGAAYVIGGLLFSGEKPLNKEGSEFQPAQIIDLRSKKAPPGPYRLWIEVTSQQAPSFPGGKPGRETATIAERVLDIPGSLGGLLHAVWKRQEMVIGLVAAELTITADHLPKNATLVVAVHDPTQIQITAFREAFNNHFKNFGPRLRGDHNPQGQSIFDLSIDFKFDRPDRDQPEGRMPLPLPVSLRISAVVSEAAPKGSRGPDVQREIAVAILERDNDLRVDFKENMFSGFVAIDLGTSSTYALIFQSQGFKTKLIHIEQEDVLRNTLRAWLQKNDGMFGSREWSKLLADACKRLHLSATPETAVSALKQYLKQRPITGGQNDDAVHSALRAIEQSAMLPSFPTDFRLTIRRIFSDMYSRAFRRFPLHWHGLRAVELDLNQGFGEGGPDAAEMVAPIPSTTRVVSCQPLSLDIGPEAEAARLEAGIANPSVLFTQFHSSPKNYYEWLGTGKRIEITAGGDPVKVTPHDFLVATLKELHKKINQYRKNAPDMPTERFSQLVMPFPTSASMSVRRELCLAAREAGFDKQTVQLDEALSAIVFYLVNPFGADLEMGLEAFRTKCRPISRGDGVPIHDWMQNILLVDIGGGTTDIALVEVRLSDLQAPGAGDGSKGRHYQLTPRLLGTTGLEQQAGNLLTLEVYHALKRRIADAVLSVLESSSPCRELESNVAADLNGSESEEVKNLRRMLDAIKIAPRVFKDEKGRYRPGSLPDEYQDRPFWNTTGTPSPAFALANQVVPSPWSNAPDHAKPAAALAFFTLWKIAEDIKVKVFGKEEDPTDTERRECNPSIIPNSREYKLSCEQIGNVIGISAATCEKMGIPTIVFNAHDFREAIDPPLKQIAMRTMDLVKSCLVKAAVDGFAANEAAPSHLILDRVILTGQTCRLPRVREVLSLEFENECRNANPPIRWDPASLVFEGEYAKRAAAIGAAYAQILHEARVEPSGAEIHCNVLDVRVDNLFFFLQSGFKVRRYSHAEKHIPIFNRGTPFVEFNQHGDGILCSEFKIQPSPTLTIDKFDFDTHGGDSWGDIRCDELAAQICMPFQQFEKEVRVAIETDHRLVVHALFCRGSDPHYELPCANAMCEVFDLLKALRQLDPKTAKSNEDWALAFAGWTVGINVRGGYGRSLFRIARDEFSKNFRVGSDRQKRKGTPTVELPPCPVTKIDKFFVRSTGPTSNWVEIGEVRRPTVAIERPIPACATLDEKGELRVHLGALSYCFAQDDHALVDSGLVLRKPLTDPHKIPEDRTNPFCGRH